MRSEGNKPGTAYQDKILKLLRSSRDGFLSGEELASKLGISRTMVWKHIKSLEGEGCVIEAVPSQGYRLGSEPDLLREGDIRRGLKTRLIGREIHLLSEAVSTNTFAMELASKGGREGTVVIAETQTGGKGRLGRTWISPRGNLYFSIILRPQLPVSKAPLITLTGAVAAARAIRTACGVPAAIKWPNDILLSGKKAAGLLTEMSAEPDRIRHVALGIGIDVNMDLSELPPDVRGLVTTLALETGGNVDRLPLLQEVLRSLERWYRVFLADPAAVLREWTALNCTIGNRVKVSGAAETIEGLARGIDQEGRLVIAQDDGMLRTVAAGDVTILKNSN